MDAFGLTLFFLLTDIEVIAGFSMERQIFCFVVYIVFLPLFFKPVKRIIQYVVHQSKMFFYQIFLLSSLFILELGIMNFFIIFQVPFKLRTDEVMIHIFLMLGFVVFDILLFYTLNCLDKSYKFAVEIRINRRKTELQQVYYKMVENHYMQNRELTHDLKNHVLTMEHLYESGERKKAVSYAEHVLESIEKIGLKKEQLRKNGNSSL